MQAKARTYPIYAKTKLSPYLTIGGLVILGLVASLSLVYMSPILTILAFCGVASMGLMFVDAKNGLLLLTLIRITLDAFHDKAEIPLGAFHRTLSLSSALGLFIFVFGLLYLLVKRISFWKLPLFYPFVLFLSICLVSLLKSTNLINSSVELTEFCSYFFLYFMLVHIFKEEKDLKKLVHVLIYSSFIPVAFSLFEILSRYNVNLAGLEPSLRIKGTLTHPNVFAFYLIIISLLVLSQYLYLKGKEGRSKYGLYFLLLQIPLIYTFTRGAWFAFVLALTTIGIVRYRKLLFFLPILLLLVVSLVPMVQFRILTLFSENYYEYSSLAWRLQIWSDSLPYFYTHPLFGNGFGDFLAIGFEIDEWYTPAHNDYLRLLVEVGIFGLGCFFFLMFRFLKWSVRVYRETNNSYFQHLALGFIALMVAYLANSVSDNLFTHGAVQWYFLSYAAIITVAANSKERFQKRIVDEQTH